MEQQYIDSKSAFIGFFKGSFFLVFLYTLFFNQFTFYLVYNTPLNQNIFSYFLDFVIIFFGLLSLLPSKKILSILKQNEFDLNKNILYKYYIQGILFVNFLLLSFILLPFKWDGPIKSVDQQFVPISYIGMGEYLTIGFIIIQIILFILLNKRIKLFK